ncbi:hypothetical protein FGO68_gene12523 [Halteria grandinella]|uniref:Carboxypeptidase n=1 Tax=Halteria grandinella TaxID=5974 RepID=A0A8J8T245_HALGN|nr:hypothetical protein FGO68_gene12523 [Halteria grandinella]
MRAVTVLASFLLAIKALPAADRVESLYQMPDLSFGLYSGYLPVAGTSKQLHYVAALSENNWQTDPVLLWFNGGPGCSSMLGWLSENGPYSIIDGQSNFTKNQYSWNKEATIIYIEAPAGVGYSLCTDSKDDCDKYNDFNSADDSMQAFVQLMTVKFPELKNNDVYITGKSYAGIFVPRLAERVDWYIGNCTANKSCPFVPKLMGYIVCNGVTDYRYDNLKGFIDTAYWFGLISTSLWNDLINNQCYENNPPVAQCNQWIDELDKNLTNIPVFDILGKCWTPTIKQTLSECGGQSSLNFDEKRQMTAHRYASFIKSPLSSKHVGANPPCTYSQPLIDFMNNAAVRKALHIPDSAPEWIFCNDAIIGNYTKYPNGSIEVYESLRGKYKMLKLSGDTDLAVPTSATKGWIENLNWPISKEWKQFFVNGQVGGYTEERENGKFLFATIHGAGHMAPQWKPAPSYHVVFNFIKNQPI